MRIVSVIILVLFTFRSWAVDVPSEMEFAGMQLKLTEGVQRMLKSDLDLITKSPKGFQTKVDRANLYFPLIERVLREETLPEDFKFLALQESSLVPDAISTSNAVGYWQFKKESAMEVGLRIDNVVDERMNIISSSRGAAKYLKKNNLTLNNWVYALLSYNLGLGGVRSKVESKYIGASKMTIDKDIHWYVIRFLAHKLAYEHAVGKEFTPSLLLITYDNCLNKSLREISNETEVDVQNIELYNKWLLNQRVPEDKSYCVILPVTPEHKQRLSEKKILGTKVEEPVIVVNNDKEKKRDRKSKENEWKGKVDISLLTELNRIKAIKAKEGDTPSKLAIQGGIATMDFLKYNDLKSYEAIVPGRIYFLQPKRKKANVLYHTVAEGESIREISQLYGVKINAIRKKNRMDKNESLQTGRVLYLRAKRPEDTPIEIKSMDILNVNSPEKQTEFSTKQTVVERKVTDTLGVKKSEVVYTTEGVYHEVQIGETLYSISKSYATSVDNIKNWNGLLDNSISVGMKLLVEKAAAKNSVIEHTVQQGETMYQISKKYDATVEDIIKWNNKVDSSVAIGEVLLIKTQD